MKRYTQLDHEQRYQISGLHKAGSHPCCIERIVLPQPGPESIQEP
jgi:hypothetical protein